MIDRKSSISTVGSTQNLVEVSTKRRFFERRKKKIITWLLPLFAGLLAAFFILFIIYHTKYKNLLAEKVCTSEDCIDSANMFLQVMDRNVDPCTDFYAYACGNFPQEHPIQDGDIYRSFFEESEQRLSRMVTQIVNHPHSITNSKSLEKTKVFYASCMNKALLEELEFQPLYDILEKVGLPKFPTASFATDFNLGKTIGRMQRYLGMDLIVNLEIDQGAIRPGESNETYILKLSPAVGNPTGGAIGDPEFKSLLEGWLTKRQIRNDPRKRNTIQEKGPEKVYEYVIKFISTVMKIILNDLDLDDESVPTNETEIRSSALEVLTFAVELNKMLADCDNSTEVTDSMTFAQLEVVLNEINPSAVAANKIFWQDFVNELFNGDQGHWTYDFNNDLIAVQTTESLKNLYMFLIPQKPLTILRFVWWHVVGEYAKYTTEEMYSAYRRLYELVELKKSAATRETICVSYVRNLFPLTIAKEIKTVFGLANQTEKAEEMLNDIKQEFINLVDSADWLDHKTKLINIEKANAISEFIGYESHILDDHIVDEFYEDLEINNKEFLMNMARRKKLDTTKAIQMLRQTNETILGPIPSAINPIEVNAYYAPVKNAIHVPAGILQRPFYFRGLESLNYGAIGSILGHELTHGFDSVGSHYDKNGTYQEEPWPQPIINKYENRAMCFIDQYSKFHLTRDQRLDGNYTLAENIADNGGLRETYYAYQTYKKKHGREVKLPGFESFTHEQLLFLSFATVWCEANTERYQNSVLKDTHSPNRVRVIGTLQNMKEFANAFQCVSGSFMNPSKKCIIW